MSAVALAAVTPRVAPPVAFRIPVGLPIPSPVKKDSSSFEPIRRANSFDTYGKQHNRAILRSGFLKTEL